MSIDVDAILRARGQRITREGYPLHVLMETFKQIEAAEEEVKRSSLTPETKWILQRSYVLTAITSCEVYFKDMLRTLFSISKKDSFLGKLQLFHKEKYGIDELLSMQFQGISPFDLVLASANFQNISEIDKVFSAIIGKPFWKAVFAQNVFTEREGTKIPLTEDALGDFGRLLNLRHELTHDPDHKRRNLTEEELAMIRSIPTLIFACDFIIIGYVMANPGYKTTKDS
jgi:hypothetical protein